MLSKAFIASLPPGKTNSVHIGSDLFAVSTKMAIDVSSDTGIQIGPSHFVQHLINHYSEDALANWDRNLEIEARQAEIDAKFLESQPTK